jgi:hypothetical protein
MEGAMRTSFAFIATAVLIAGCSPQEQIRTSDYYLRPENSAEFAKALETCRTSGMSNKEKCGPVWQAKFAVDRAEEKALIDKAMAEQDKGRRASSDQGEGGVSVVPQAPKPAASAPMPARAVPKGETADAASSGAAPAARN